MRITNRHGLPEAVYNFLARDRYVPGDNDISVTTLIGPPLKAALIKEHNEELETDAMDLVWSLLGNGVHHLLDNHTQDGVAEERLYATRSGVTIGGQIDNRHGTTISDYKVTSTYKVMKQSFDDWENQLNCYAWLCRENGIPIEKLNIIVFLRDWRESEVVKNADYPRTPCVILDIPLWEWEQQEAYIHDRLEAHKERRDCTPEEMWAEPDKLAVQRPDAKRARRVFDTEEEAIDACNIGVEIVVHRPGRRRHCERYCPARDVCPLWKEFNGTV